MSQGFSDHFSSIASSYADFRPTYPADLFEWLAKQTPAHDTVWDCACGNGQASRSLAQYYKRVIATDGSEAQIAEAQPSQNIEYLVATAENSGLPDNIADLITVATALHWFDFDKFYSEAKRVAKPGGVLAVWCYGYLIIEDIAVNALVEHFYSHTVHAYWPTGRNHVDSGYRTLPFPLDEIDAPAFTMEVSWGMPQLLGYLRTWSSTLKYIQEHGTDPVDDLEKQLGPVWGDPSSLKTIRWPLALRVGRI